MFLMILMIDGKECPIEWEENESVEALKELCPLTVEMSSCIPGTRL